MPGIRRPHGLTVLELVIVLATLALMAAAIIPLLAPFSHGRPKSAEVRNNLRAMHAAEMAYFSEHDSQSDDATKIGFGPERGNRYAYFLADRGTILRRDTSMEVGKTGQIVGIDEFKYGRPHKTPESWAATRCPLTLRRADGTVATLGLNPPMLSQPVPPDRASFLFAAAGNIDNDADLDCWSIASFDRMDAHGKRIEAGEPHNDHSDTE